MLLQHNKSLKEFNTFGIDVTAERFASISSEIELQQILSAYNKEPLFVLGGGSNMLLTKNIKALVLHINSKGIELLQETDSHISLKVNAGENWHEFVLYCINKGYGGVENMSLIPGNVGTAPIQNIGAYGVELESVFKACEAIEIATGKKRVFSKDECKFGYRNSIFKNELKGQFVITNVHFTLTKKKHSIKTSYGAIQEALAAKNIEHPTIKDISEAVITIRNSKLPDPSVLGNSGSFFKNPVVATHSFELFQSKFPTAPFYKVSDTEFKIPAGWLIEQAGFKGKRYGDAGVHTHQALVLVNHGNASGQEIWSLAMKIQQAVKEQFGITIVPEVNVF